MKRNDAYALGLRLACSTHGLTKLATMTAEALASALQGLPREGLPVPPIDVGSRRRDPKDPEDDAGWTGSGPVGWDNMTQFGFNPDIEMSLTHI